MTSSTRFPLSSDPARSDALARLIALGDEAARRGAAGSAANEGARLLSYVTRARERTARVHMSQPWLVFVLEGRKRVDFERRGTTHVLAPGDALVLPAGSTLDLANMPDRTSGTYRALAVELLGDAHALLRRHHPDLVGQASTWLGRAPRRVVAGTTSLRALAHVCETILDAEAHPRVLHHRLEGLLLSLLVEDQVPSAAVPRAQAASDVARAVRNVVREAPDAEWPAREVAARLGLSEATLRRRLAAQGTQLRSLLLDERLEVAALLLRDPRVSVGEAALRCGYASGSKFARQFRKRFGVLPSRVRTEG
jgi:AraC-like DNA-binding protein/mannose-6-phosphate isomerase-like protein (cupin superfamily)